MKKFFIQENNQTIGPLSVEELTAKGITQSTLVWTEGMDEWKAAGTFEELLPTVSKLPPAYPSKLTESGVSSNELPIPGRNKKVILSLTVAFICVFSLVLVYLLAFNTNEKKEDLENESLREDIMATKKEQIDNKEVTLPPPELTEAQKLAAQILYEKRNPAVYISPSWSSWENFADEFVVEGDFMNTAKNASFKNIKIAIGFLSKTDVLLGSKEEVIYEYLGPGYSVKRKYKYLAPESTHKATIKVVSADPAN